MKNTEIIDELLAMTGIKNDSQLADYLSRKYGKEIKRNQIGQFRRSDAMTVTSMLLREMTTFAQCLYVPIDPALPEGFMSTVGKRPESHRELLNKPFLISKYNGTEETLDGYEYHIYRLESMDKRPAYHGGYTDKEYALEKSRELILISNH